jgi:hypothetical protein
MVDGETSRPLTLVPTGDGTVRRRPAEAAPPHCPVPASKDLSWQDLPVLSRDRSPLDVRVPTTELAQGIWSLQGNPDPDLDKTDAPASTTRKCYSAAFERRSGVGRLPHWP